MTPLDRTPPHGDPLLHDAGVVVEAENDWVPGDPCGICGSTDTGWDIVEGGVCRSCGAQDSDA